MEKRRGGQPRSRFMLYGKINSNRFKLNHRVWRPRLDQKLENTEPFTLHDIRRSVATQWASLGVSPHVIERLLNHVSGQISGIAAIYNRFQYAAEMRDAIEMWEKHLKKLLA